MRVRACNSNGALDELPDDHVFSDAEKETIGDLVWTGYFQNHRDPGPAVWGLHQLISNESRAKRRGRQPTVGEIREVIRRDEEQRHVGFYRCASDSTLYDSDAYDGRGGLFSAAYMRANEPKRYALLVRRREHFAKTGELPNF